MNTKCEFKPKQTVFWAASNRTGKDGKRRFFIRSGVVKRNSPNYLNLGPHVLVWRKNPTGPGVLEVQARRPEDLHKTVQAVKEAIVARLVKEKEELDRQIDAVLKL